jgi:hypothetical protein
VKNIYEVIILKKEKRNIDENFFKAMNYELAGEIGAIDNEEMKKNKKMENIHTSHSIVNNVESNFQIKTDNYNEQPRD